MRRIAATDNAANAVLLTWKRFIQGRTCGGFVPDVVLRSWERSRAAGVDPEPRQLDCRRIEESALRRRLEANRELLEVAVPHLDRMSSMLGRERHFCSIQDSEGMILYAAGTDEETRHRLGVLPGYDWSEACRGTTAAAVSLAESQPYAAIGAEHYVNVLHSVAGDAAPIHAPGQMPLAVLSLTVPVAAQEVALVMLVAHTAHLIEQELLRRLVATRANLLPRRILPRVGER